jgi:hypothetical protein
VNTHRSSTAPRGRRFVLLLIATVVIAAGSALAVRTSPDADAQTPPPTNTTTSSTSFELHCPMTTMPPPCERWRTTTTPTVTTTTTRPGPAAGCPRPPQIPEWYWDLLVRVLRIRCRPTPTTTTTTTAPTTTERTTTTLPPVDGGYLIGCLNGQGSVQMAGGPREVHPGDTITIQLAANRGTPVGSGYFPGERDAFRLVRPEHITDVRIMRGPDESEPVTGDGPRLTIPAPNAIVIIAATIAADSRPGDVIDWLSPTFDYEFVSRRLLSEPPHVIEDLRQVSCGFRPPRVAVRHVVVG